MDDLNRTLLLVRAAAQLDRILNFELTVGTADHSLVSELAAHGRIERCSCRYDRTFFPVGKRLGQFFLRRQNGDLGFFLKRIIAVKFSGQFNRNLVVDSGIGTAVVGALAGERVYKELLIGRIYERGNDLLIVGLVTGVMVALFFLLYQGMFAMNVRKVTVTVSSFYNIYN